MKVKDIIKVFRRNWLLITAFPLLLGGLVYYFTGKQKKTFTSDFLVYTGIASGYKLTSEENPRVDNLQVSNAFDNYMTTLKARQTLEEVSLRLLANHLLVEKPDPMLLGAENYQNLQNLFPAEVKAKVVVEGSVEETLINLKKLRETSEHNIVSKLLNSESYIYGIAVISANLQAKRRDNSDMIQVWYTANDPAVAQMTLAILGEVFLGRIKDLKEGEINNVVAYFEDQAQKSYARLKRAEDALKDFGVKYKIVDYQDQAKNLAASKKELEELVEREKLAFAGAQATIKNIDKKLAGRTSLMEHNQKIMDKRRELAEVNHKIANADLKSSNGKDLLNLKQEAEKIKEELQNIVNELYKINNTEEGIPGEDLLNQYLQNLILADEASAKLSVMENLLADYDSKYKEFAPLGATLAALQREVTVAEKEYLDALESLNTNRQKQKNLTLTSNVKLVDSPRYPIKPDAAKRQLLVGGAMFAGFVLIVSGLIGMAFLDGTIRTPDRAQEITGLEIAGVLPAISKKKGKDFDYLEKNLADQCVASILLASRKVEKPVKIAFTATKDGEGKLRVAAKIGCHLARVKGKVLLLYPHTAKIAMESFLKVCLNNPDGLVLEEYSIDEKFIDSSVIADFTDLSVEEFDYVITVLPALNESGFPVKMLDGFSLPILVLSADRKWTDADNYFLNRYKRACSKNPALVLNNVSIDELEEIYGKVPNTSRESNKNKKGTKNIKISKAS